MDRSQPEAANLHTVSIDQTLSRLHEMFGADRAGIFSGNNFRVIDEEMRVVAFPFNLEELREMLQLATSERWRVIPAGAGTWLEMGNRPPQFHLVISVEKMNRVIEYEPADLTATVEAGCTLSAFNMTAAGQRQFIPLDPFGDERSTIGGIVATGSSGPMRCAYGTPRDWLIGIQVAHANGSITRAGGKVVKNVAGYDLCKLYTGSFGSLGVITEMSFKLRALPSFEKTLTFYADDATALCALLSKIADSDVQLTACELISPSQAALPLETGRFALVLRFLNEPETTDSQINDALRLAAGLSSTVFNRADAENFWLAYHESEISDRWKYILRLSALPADLQTTLNDFNRILPAADWRAHAANGVIRIHAEAGWLDSFKNRERARKLAELRQRVQSRGGQLVILRATDDVIEQLDVWGDAGTTASLMRGLKYKFDPQGRLNHGRFVAGI
jgi:glycolate oxidase FAD binding subunit